MGATFATVGSGPSLDPALEEALRRLDRLVNWERRDRIGRMRVSVEPSRDLVRRLGDPQRAFVGVHVAGTKGKGSVAQLIAGGLEALGVRTGVYGSPHVERVTERVRIGLDEIEDAALARVLERSLGAREAGVRAGTPAGEATWFDVLTGAAFAALAEAQVRVGVVECGLGGRLDSTNVLNAPTCVLTGVELEHTAVLGPTREAIAREKAGILSPGATLLTPLDGRRDPAGRAVAREARRRGARVAFVPVDPEASLAEANATLARAVLDALEQRLGAGFLERGSRRGRWSEALDAEVVRRAALPGRLERRRSGSVPVVLDGAHVAASLARVLRELEGEPGLGGPPVVVFGTGREKDSQALLKLLAGRADRVLCTSVGDGPYRHADELVTQVRAFGGEAEVRSDPRAALDAAVRLAEPEGWVLVTGSLHLVGAVRSQTQDP